MNQNEFKSILFENRNKLFSVYVSYGIDTLQNDYAEIFIDTKSNTIFFVVLPYPLSMLEATLSIDKIVSVQYGGNFSPIALKGSKPDSKNILITYNSAGVEKEILFSNANFTLDAFNDFYKYLNSNFVEAQKVNDQGFIEL